MKLIRKSLLLTAVLAGVGIACMSAARADAFAQSILIVDNFKVLHSNGTAFSTIDFGMLHGDNMARATATLNNNSLGTVPQVFNALSGAGDVAHQLIGLANASHHENNFAPFPPPPAVPGTYGYADQNLAGSIITVGTAGAGATAQTRADAALGSHGSGSGFSDVATLTTFNFTMGVADSMTFAFDGTPFTQAYAGGDPYLNSNAMAGLSWTLNIMNMSTSEIVFSYKPPELNSFGMVSRTGSDAGLSIYNPGTMVFTATTPQLQQFQNYQLSINHSTLANALQLSTVPEPHGLALCGLGLLGAGLLARRRNA